MNKQVEDKEKAMKYRKKPVVIDAVLWDETKETLETLHKLGMNYTSYKSHVSDNFVRSMHIETLKGSMLANKGDYIIKGVKGEFYPCKPDIFEATYEKVDE